MSMRIRPSLKAVIVALPTTVWLTQADAGTWPTIAFAVGAAYVSFAWMVFAPPPRPAAPPAAPELALTVRGCFEPRHGAPRHRIARAPTRRGPRDLRCPASRAAARARRSTRR
jgi:hypothetical protein